jgi:arylsulfatase A-like enzyme
MTNEDLQVDISEGENLGVDISGGEELQASKSGGESLQSTLGEKTAPSVSLSSDTPNAPNVLWIVLDDLGIELMEAYATHPFVAAYHALATYPNRYPYLPNLNRLASVGHKFNNFYCNPICGPTRATQNTARYGFRTGFGTNNAQRWDLQPEEESYAEWFANGGRGGYNCRHFGKWHLNESDNTEENDRSPVDEFGFGRYWGIFANPGGETDELWDGSPAATGHHYYWRNVRVTSGTRTVVAVGNKSGGPFDRTTYIDSVVRAAVQSLGFQGTAPWVVSWCQSAPHAPQQVPPHNGTGYDQSGGSDSLIRQDTIDGNKNGGGTWSTGLIPLPAPSATEAAVGEEEQQWFWAQCEAIDSEIGELLGSMSQADLQDTIIIVSGDNGTPGRYVDPTFDPGVSPSALSGFKASVREGGIRAPMFVCNVSSFTPAGPSTGSTTATSTPGRLPYFTGGPREIDELVMSVDIPVTIADFCGVDMSQGSTNTIDGVSFRKVMANPGTRVRTRAFCEQFSPSGPDAATIFYKRSMRDFEGYKYYMVENPIGDGVVEEFYNVEDDPLEQTDLVAAGMTGLQQNIFNRLKADMVALVGAHKSPNWP